MKLLSLEKLKSALGALITSAKPTALMDSPQAMAVKSAERAQAKLATIDSVTDAGERAKRVAAGAKALAAARPSNFEQAMAVNETLAEVVDALNSKPETAGPATHGKAETRDTFSSLVEDVLALTSDPNVRTLAQARQSLLQINDAAQKLEAIGAPHGASSAASLIATPAGTKIALIEAMFTNAGASLHAALSTNDPKYLARFISAKAAATGTGAPGAATGERVVTLRTATIEMPPTKQEIFAVYQSLPRGERRTAFYDQHQRAIWDAKRELDQKEKDEKFKARALETLVKSKVESARILAENAKRADLTAQLKAVGHRA